jgi:hypothetical protein
MLHPDGGFSPSASLGISAAGSTPAKRLNFDFAQDDNLYLDYRIFNWIAERTELI